MALHLEIKDAASPARRAVQSKNMWNESDINPKLFIEQGTKAHILITSAPLYRINTTLMNAKVQYMKL